jgi:tRNA(Leu) C34 or U34 (ribose-2'-O)-methylase TrmL
MTGIPCYSGEKVHKAVDERLTIPMMLGMRSINVAQSVSMVLGEALRQINISSGIKEY